MRRHQSSTTKVLPPPDGPWTMIRALFCNQRLTSQEIGAGWAEKSSAAISQSVLAGVRRLARSWPAWA